MAISSRKQIRDHAMSITDTEGSIVEDLVNAFINDTIREIGEPGWAYAPRKERHHLWTWLRKHEEFDTVAAQADYVLDREVDKIAGIKFDNKSALSEVNTDEFMMIADPTLAGTPRVYLQWSMSGVSTKLATADTIDVVSDSASDAGDADLSVTVWGYSSGILRSETYALTGATPVTGSITFDADDIYVSKGKNTTGSITVTENSGSTTLVKLGPTESNPIFKVIKLHRVPNAALNGDIYYYTRIRELENDSDVPQFDHKWHHVVTKGVVAKIFQHLGKESEKNSAIAFYRSNVRSMIESDQAGPNRIPDLKRHLPKNRFPIVRRTTDAIS